MSAAVHGLRRIRQQRFSVLSLQPLPLIAERKVWASPCSLAATRGISSVSFPLATEMFHFARLASACADRRGSHDGVAPFGHSRITACSTAPRDFSQSRHVLHRHVVSRHPPYTLEFRFFFSAIQSQYDQDRMHGDCCIDYPIGFQRTRLGGRGVARQRRLTPRSPKPLYSLPLQTETPLARRGSVALGRTLTHALRRV